jgi:hypothetical protein
MQQNRATLRINQGLNLEKPPKISAKMSVLRTRRSRKSAKEFWFCDGASPFPALVDPRTTTTEIKDFGDTKVAVADPRKSSRGWN